MKAWGTLLTCRVHNVGEETPKKTSKKLDLVQTILAKALSENEKSNRVKVIKERPSFQ